LFGEEGESIPIFWFLQLITHPWKIQQLINCKHLLSSVLGTLSLFCLIVTHVTATGGGVSVSCSVVGVVVTVVSPFSEVSLVASQQSGLSGSGGL